MFKHNFVSVQDIEAITTEKGRYYIAPSGEKLNSVTTVLSKIKKQGLINWRKRVGDAEADGIMRQASTRGTAIHDLLEKYLLNVPEPQKSYNSLTRERFRMIKPLLDNHISEIYGLEVPLYSLTLKAAGRIDMACVWDGTPSIVDFKTSNRLKTREYIENYFIQAAAYAYMLEALTGINTSRLVILIMVEHELQPQVFVENRSDWESKMLDLFETPTPGVWES